MITFLLVLALLLSVAMAVRHAAKWFLRPLSREEKTARENAAYLAHRAESRKGRIDGKAPDILVKHKWGPLGVRNFRATDYFRYMTKRYPRFHLAGKGLANVAEGFYDGGLSTYYPADVVPNNASNPYNQRYLLVKSAPQGTTLPATLAPSWNVLADDICYIMAVSDISVPLGIITDDVGNAALDAPPYSGNVTYLGNACKSTNQLVLDAQLPAGSLVIGSRVTAGYGGAIPAVAGMFWCVGMTIGTNEGAGTVVEIDAGRFPVGVDIIT